MERIYSVVQRWMLYCLAPADEERSDLKPPSRRFSRETLRAQASAGPSCHYTSVIYYWFSKSPNYSVGLQGKLGLIEAFWKLWLPGVTWRMWQGFLLRGKRFGVGDGGGYLIFELISPIKISFLHVKRANALALIIVCAIYFLILPLYISAG